MRMTKRVSPNTVPKAVDKSMNKRARAHACWDGGVCLKKQQLMDPLRTATMGACTADLRLFLLFRALALRLFQACVAGHSP